MDVRSVAGGTNYGAFYTCLT